MYPLAMPASSERAVRFYSRQGRSAKTLVRACPKTPKEKTILRLANCDPKSVNYFASQLPLLDGPEWDMDKQYKVASNVKPYQAADHIGKVLGDTAFVLP